MLPSNLCHKNVKLRHRNVVTAAAPSKENLSASESQQISNPGSSNNITNNHNLDSCTEKFSKEKDLRDRRQKNSGLSSNECECYMTHRRCSSVLSESSDDSQSQINQAGIIDDYCEEYENKSFFDTSNTMIRPNDIHRQTSISQMGSNAASVKPKCNRSRAFNLFVEVAIRVMLIASFMKMERTTPFKRIIHPEEIWLYQNPVSTEYVPASVILLAVIFAPLILIIISYLFSRDKKDFVQANYAFTLAIGITGFITSLMKISIGRPRPDFVYRCYPDGIVHDNSFDQCTGDPMAINEGRKSFPSGHSSMAFASFGFMTFYLASKLHIFNDRGRGRTWRLCLAFAPLVVAAEVAISRTCDYRHHWQDVVVGSLIGICVSYLCYRQYFPSIFSKNCHRSYPRSARITTNQVDCEVPVEDVDEIGESQPLIGGEKDDKWI